jgi:1,2-phenylacetyl-CoA epoxidase PaaB subunit
VERYRVLGRTAYPEPLEHQGTVEAADDAAAAAAALDRFGRRWVELVLVPERAVHWVLGPSGEAGGG